MMLSDVCRVHPVSGRRVRPAWLKAAAARFRCRPGRGYIVAAARLQLVRIAQKIPLFFQVDARNSSVTVITRGTFKTASLQK